MELDEVNGVSAFILCIILGLECLDLAPPWREWFSRVTTTSWTTLRGDHDDDLNPNKTGISTNSFSLSKMEGLPRVVGSH